MICRSDVATLHGPGLVDGFKAKLKSFETSVKDFLAGVARIPSHRAKIASLKARLSALPPGAAPDIASRVGGLSAAVEELSRKSYIAPFLEKAKKLIAEVKSHFGLGQDPVTITLAIAAMIGVMAITVGWVKHEKTVQLDLANEEKKLALVESGLLPPDVIGQSDKGGFLGDAKQLVTMVVVGGLALFLLPKIIKGRG